jgi:hypothetical protein
MYVNLLVSALEQQEPDVDEVTKGASLARLLCCRRRLRSATFGPRTTQSPSTAIGDQLAYDVALIRLARQWGVVCQASEFDQPQWRRNQLEETLASKGVHLDDLDPQC